MVLTSSQVSVAISTFIVFFFTTALFMAGYVLQQQTVRDIRAVIKPQLVRAPPQGPELFLPPQFREDGYLVDVIVDPVLPPKDQEQKEQTDVEVETTKVPSPDNGEEEGSEEQSTDEDMIGATRWQKATKKKQMEALKAQQHGTQKPMVVDKEHGSSSDNGQKSEAQKEEEKLSRAERRKRIKEQILADGEGESFKGYRRRMW